MAHAHIYMTNDIEIKKVPVGFSWTVLFFGCIPALVRQDWLWGVLMLVFGMVTYGLFPVVCSFFYNRVYAKSLFEKGWYVKDFGSEITEDGLKAYLGYVALPGKKAAV